MCVVIQSPTDLSTGWKLNLILGKIKYPFFLHHFLLEQYPQVLLCLQGRVEGVFNVKLSGNKHRGRVLVQGLCLNSAEQ